jgi:hypothetical protein
MLCIVVFILLIFVHILNPIFLSYFIFLGLPTIVCLKKIDTITNMSERKNRYKLFIMWIINLYESNIYHFSIRHKCFRLWLYEINYFYLFKQLLTYSYFIICYVVFRVEEIKRNLLQYNALINAKFVSISAKGLSHMLNANYLTFL